MASQGGIRIPVPLVIEMTPEQVQVYANENGLPRDGGPLRNREIVEDVRAYVEHVVQESYSFGNGGADVTIKGRG